MINRKPLALVALSLLALAACDKEPTGQVAAVVNGDEITLQEINAELGNTPIPEGIDKAEIQQAALQRILDRRLLAQAARKDDVDKSPEYMLRERQLKDALLVQILGQKAQRVQRVPSQSEIDKFISGNPVMFAERKLYALDRIQFPFPKDMTQLKALENDHSMDAVAARLDSLGVKFTRSAAQIDSAQVGAERIQQIKSLPAGEPFVVPENGMVTVGVIKGEQAIPLVGAEARPLAVQAIQNKQLGESMQQKLKSTRAAADISYQPGFAPKKSADKATPKK